MPSKQSRNVKVQSRPVSSSVSNEQSFFDRLSLIVRIINDKYESYGQYHTCYVSPNNFGYIITEYGIVKSEMDLITSEFEITSVVTDTKDTVKTSVIQRRE